MNLRWTILLFGALLAGAPGAAPGDRSDVVRDLAGRMGPIVGSALACRDIARPRIQRIVDRPAERQFADLDRPVARPALPAAAVAPSFAAATAAVVAVYPAAAKFIEKTHDIFPGMIYTDVSLEGFISANILIEAVKRAGPQLDTEKLIDVLENMPNLDPGLGVPLGFGHAEHQPSHKSRGTAIDENGKYQTIELA